MPPDLLMLGTLTTEDPEHDVLVVNAYGDNMVAGRADARLIAKAPEMYDCLRAMVDDHDPSECETWEQTTPRHMTGPGEATEGWTLQLCWPHRLLAEIDGS